MEETVALVRRWWAGEPVDHHTDRWSFAGVTCPVRPAQDPLEVWLGGRLPKALDRAGRIADGWLGATITPAEASAARASILAAAEAAGRVFDLEHVGMSLPYARTEPDQAVLGFLAARRPDLDPAALLPVGPAALRSTVARHVEAGVSKFVVRPVAAVRSWEDEADWLGSAILDLQT